MNAYEIGAHHLHLAGRAGGDPDRCMLPVSRHFPPVIRDALVRAAATPLTPADPLARVKAIDHAVERARRAYPELFRPDA